MTEGELKWLVLDDEEQWKFFKSLLCFKGVYFREVYEQLNDAQPQEAYKVLPIDKVIIQDIKKYFFKSGAFSKVKYLDDKTDVALPIDTYSELLSICNLYGLDQYIIHIAVIVSIASTEKISVKGKKPIINQNLSKLKDLLASDVIESTIAIDPSSGSHVALFKDKFSLEKVTLEFKHPTNDSLAHESVSFKGEEFKEHILYDLMKFKLVKLITEVQFSEKHIISSNTNVLFCKSFYNFIDKETPYSSSKVPKADILRLFIKVYKLAGYELKGYKAKLDNKDELDIAETWLKASAN